MSFLPLLQPKKNPLHPRCYRVSDAWRGSGKKIAKIRGIRCRMFDLQMVFNHLGTRDPSTSHRFLSSLACKEYFFFFTSIFMTKILSCDDMSPGENCYRNNLFNVPMITSIAVGYGRFIRVRFLPTDFSLRFGYFECVTMHTGQSSDNHFLPILTSV